VCISTNFAKIASLARGVFKTRLVLAAILVLAVGFGCKVSGARRAEGVSVVVKESRGGPVADTDMFAASLAYAAGLGRVGFAVVETAGAPRMHSGSGAVLGRARPSSNVIPLRQGLKKYRVQEGDTLSEIAAQFGISMDTLKWANPGVGNTIRPGDELTILPVTGFLYKVEEGDTLENLSARYGVSAALIIKYNPEYQKLLASPGEQMVLPYSKPENLWAYIRKASERLPNLNDYFSLPARGWNWGRLHYYNAVDIAAKCGDPIYASAEGIVTEESSGNYWNEGYGNVVVIRHANGTETVYAHTLKNLVVEGDYVLQGEKIALIGNTGNTDGPTGCHLHFEVHGAQNPFAVQ